MANYLTTDTELTSIANAIRTKGGTNAQLTFPTGFVTAINNISTGGGAAEVAATLYTANNGNKNSFSLDNNGSYYSSGDVSIFNAITVNAQYGMVADSNGYVVWKGKLLSHMFPVTGGMGDTYLYTGGGVDIKADTYVMTTPGEIDPETGEMGPDIEENIYEININTDPHETTVYISSVAF